MQSSDLNIGNGSGQIVSGTTEPGNLPTRQDTESPNQSHDSGNNQEQLSHSTIKKQTKLTWTLIPEPTAA
jgi:hypothetical protein